MQDILDTEQKAFAINMDSDFYGTFAEIGAGQEVARHFFRAGGAAGTIAKTISAYDMIVSDTIYGKENSGRYVCEDRLNKMLDKEFHQLVERLASKRDKKTRFFAFADTVAAKSFKNTGDGHGWLGVMFQHKAGAKPSRIIIHIRMLDLENLQQQSILGEVGVNLLYTVFNYKENQGNLIDLLLEGLNKERIQIDMIRIEGPAFSNLDNRILCLKLVQKDFCNAIMFDEKGNAQLATDVIYKKNLLVCRGSYRPPTLVNLDMLKCGKRRLQNHLEEDQKENILVFAEISMNKLRERGEVDKADFIARVDLLTALKQNVLITNYDEFYELNEYLVKYSKGLVGVVLGVYNLQRIFSPECNSKLKSGVLGGLAALFAKGTRLFVYPSADDEDEKKMLKTENVPMDDRLTFLLMYLIENNYIEDIDDYNQSVFGIWSRTVLSMIQKGESGWEKMVPKTVANQVARKRLFGAK